jgi:hypothetical protein
MSDRKKIKKKLFPFQILLITTKVARYVGSLLAIYSENTLPYIHTVTFPPEHSPAVFTSVNTHVMFVCLFLILFVMDLLLLKDSL